MTIAGQDEVVQKSCVRRCWSHSLCAVELVTWCCNSYDAELLKEEKEIVDKIGIWNEEKEHND